MSSRTFFDYQNKQLTNQRNQNRPIGKSASRRALGDITNRNFIPIQNEENVYVKQPEHKKDEKEYPPIEKMYFAPPPKQYEGYHYEIDDQIWFDTEIELEPQPLYEPMKW